MYCLSKAKLMQCLFKLNLVNAIMALLRGFVSMWYRVSFNDIKDTYESEWKYYSHFCDSWRNLAPYVNSFYAEFNDGLNDIPNF